MNPIPITLNPSHTRTMFVRLLVSGLVALLLGVLLALPALAAGSGTWTATGSLNNVRDSFAAVTLTNGKVLVSGGEQNGYPLAITGAELYNPSTGTWTNTGSMNTNREDHTAVLLSNGKVIVAAGVGIYDYLTSAELYDPSTGTWTVTGSMNVAREYHTMTLLQSGQVLVAGGVNSSGTLASAEVYTP